MTFAHPSWFWALSALPVLILLGWMGYWRNLGYLGFSDHRLLNKAPRRFRLIAALPALLAIATAVLIVVALARPQVPGTPQHRTVRGRDIELIVDISFSMSFPFKGHLEPHVVPPELQFKQSIEERRRNDKGLHFDQPKEGLQRIHASQNALLRFIENRWKGQTGDRIGLIVFDVTPRYAWPLTDDLRMLYRKAQFIQNNLGTGTNFGKNPPGPIDLAVNHFKEYGQAKSEVLIMVTDGEDQIDPQTMQRLINLIKDNHLRFYLIGIGETLARQDVDIYKVATAVGGQVFRVEDTKSIDECFAKIDQMEKSEVTISEIQTRDEVFFYFAWAALACLGGFLVLEVFVLTR